MDKKTLKLKEQLQKELNRIVDIVIRKYSPEKIILFGSLVTGNIHKYSDIDLVIVKDTKDRFIKRLHEVRLMTHPQVGVDFIVYTPRELKDMQDKNRRFLTNEIMQKGEVIYEKKNNWFEFAKDDLVVARASLEKKIYNLACFHAQEGVEKMLKGYHSLKGKDVPKTHSIGYLLKLSKEINQDFERIKE